MASILHDFTIRAPRRTVFDAVTTSAGLSSWWTKECEGAPEEGRFYRFHFSSDYDWRGVVVKAERDRAIAWDFTDADDDWTGTRLSFTLDGDSGETRVAFRHDGWRDANGHFRTSSFCWASYLRLLKRYVEHGEVVAYDQRDDA